MDFAGVSGFSGNGSQVSVYLGNGDGTFQSPIDDLGIAGVPVLATADFNGDGKPDLAAATLYGTMVALGHGDCTFQAASTVNAGLGRLIATGDFNGDGKVDLAVGGAVWKLPSPFPINTVTSSGHTASVASPDPECKSVVQLLYKIDALSSRPLEPRIASPSDRSSK